MGDFKFEVWPTEYRQIMQYFGVNPHNYAQFGLPGHDGIDIRAPTGSKVFCVAPGEVFKVYNRPTGHNYGIHVRVRHQDGFRTVYAHLQKALVRQGQIVKAGTVLGLADNTGNSFGSHLHITLKKDGAKYRKYPNEIVDPTPFLLPLMGWQEPAGPYVEGWVLTDAIFIRDQLAQVSAGGATLYVNPSVKRLIPSGTIVIVGSGKELFTRVRVSRAAIGLKDREPPQPAPEPPALIATVDGWAWKHYLIMVGAQALTGTHGVNLRAGPSRRAANIGMVKANSTVGRLGTPKGNYIPVRVRRNDFQEPVSLANPPPDPAVIPPENGYLGWVLTQYLSPLSPQQALTSRLGVNLRNKPDQSGQNIGLVKAFATVSLAGPTKGAYSPILARVEEVLNAAEPMPDIELPGSAPKEEPPKPVPIPEQNTTPGWAFTNGLIGAGDKAKTGRYGSNLRAAPQRDAKKIGYIPPGVEIIVTDSPSGEYTPVRVRDDRLKPPPEDRDDPDLDSQILGQARIGLHASADPDIDEGEFQEFALMRPGIIKVLSFHSGEDIARLAAAHPSAHFVLRAFLSFGGRNISPGRFVDYTLKDVRRALARLKGRNVVVELHNEPNLFDEGLGSSWSDGTTFDKWWTDLLNRYRRALPGVRFIYPGLSPGTTVTGVKQDHIRFLEASRSAVEAADGLGIHLYWSNVYPMSRALAVLDDHISRFRARSIWITEASHNQGEINPVRMAQEYLRFWRELQSRPVVQGVTYFVASASEPKFAHEVWVGKGIARLIGRR